MFSVITIHAEWPFAVPMVSLWPSQSLARNEEAPFMLCVRRNGKIAYDSPTHNDPFSAEKVSFLAGIF